MHHSSCADFHEHKHTSIAMAEARHGSFSLRSLKSRNHTLGRSDVVGVEVLDLIDGTVNVEVVVVVRKGPNTPSCLFRPKLG